MKLPCRLQRLIVAVVLRASSSSWRRRRIYSTLSTTRGVLGLVFFLMKAYLLQGGPIVVVVGIGTPCVVDSPATSLSEGSRRTAASTIEGTSILRRIELRRPSTTRSLFSTIFILRSSWSLRIAINSLDCLSHVAETISWLSLRLRSRQEIVILSGDSLDRRGSPHGGGRSLGVVVVVSGSAAARTLTHCLAALLNFGPRPTS